jgi:hypothetical protein
MTVIETGEIISVGGEDKSQSQALESKSDPKSFIYFGKVMPKDSNLKKNKEDIKLSKFCIGHNAMRQTLSNNCYCILE